MPPDLDHISRYGNLSFTYLLQLAILCVARQLLIDVCSNVGDIIMFYKDWEEKLIRKNAVATIMSHRTQKVTALSIGEFSLLNMESFGEDSILTKKYSSVIGDIQSRICSDSSERMESIMANSEPLAPGEFATNVAQINISSELRHDKKDTSRTDCGMQVRMTHPEKPEEEDVERALRKNYKDRKDFCIYCEKDISHFARHMFTWHEAEFDVQRITSMKKNSRQKKEAWSLLRKRGNFIRNRSNNVLRPVKRVNNDSKLTADDFLPCSHCLGFYERKSLFRHSKRCSENPNFGKQGKRQSSQSNGQTTLLLGTSIKHHNLLKDELFPRMRADAITLVAKKDFLICEYAYSYLKGRRSKGNLDILRQNIRRLAKLLKFAISENEEIKQLMDVLRPCYFQLIIKAVNVIARYNPETDIYESPTLAMNFGTLIKKCCDLAYINLIQKPDTNDQRKDLKILKTLVESQWSNEISAQAATNLNEKKWNKNELLPLTSDLKKLNEYLLLQAEEKYKQLTCNENNKLAYNTLKEVLYCQIILLNRRRPAEVAQLKVQTFKSINLNNQEENEFESCLTETEKILLKSYSRIVIRGKRGRGVPILLSPTMRKHFERLVEIRENFVLNNDYVFHTSGRSFIDGTKILFKYANKCGIQRANTITATRLRKHLATVTQLLQFSDKDLEQLSTFMGHTLKTHCNVYRLSDNMYQTAKVSKLLLLMTEGGVEQFKGMNIDDININLDTVLVENDVMNDILASGESQSEEPLRNNSYDKSEEESNKIIHKTKHLTNNRKLNKQIRDSRVLWTEKQKKIIITNFRNHIQKKKSPRRQEIQALINTYPDEFREKKWTSIKALVCNVYNSRLKVSFQLDG